jgi:hypothetical protein
MLAIGLGIPFNKHTSLFNPLILAYIARVQADGGTVFVDAKHIEKRLKQIACL